MGVFIVAGKPRFGLVKRQLRQQCHAVEGFLAVGDDVVAERFKLEPRKRLVGALGLLQADDIGRAILQPGHEGLKPLPDRIDVPGSDAHAKVSRPKAARIRF